MTKNRRILLWLWYAAHQDTIYTDPLTALVGAPSIMPIDDLLTHPKYGPMLNEATPELLTDIRQYWIESRTMAMPYTAYIEVIAGKYDIDLPPLKGNRSEPQVH